MEYTVTIYQGNNTYAFTAEYNTPLYYLLTEKGFIINHDSCKGTGLCGKCLIKASGRLNKQSAEEHSLVGDELSAQGYRLACYCYIRGDCSIILMNEDSPKKPLREYGFSVDLGSAVIMMNLFDIENQAHIDSAIEPNRQLSISSDIPGRIKYWNQSLQNKKEMRNMLIDELESMMMSLLNKHDISPEEIGNICTVGNTCMIHMLAGIDVSSLASPNHAPLTRDNLSIRAKQVFPRFKNARLNLMGSISGTVGSDAVATALSIGVYKSLGPVIIVNFGTNTEILIGNKNLLLARSIDSTPIIEGSLLSCGCSPVNKSGVIYSVSRNKYKIEYKTTGDTAPIGIAPAAAIEALDIMLDVGIIDKNGKMADISSLKASKLRMVGIINDEQVFFLDRKHNIYITQQDVYLLQRLKATVLCNIMLLLEEFDISSSEEIAAVYFCNTFGGMLNASSAINIGMIPAIFENKTFGIGNSSSRGADIILCSPRARANAEHIRTYARDFVPDESYKERISDFMELRRY